MSNMSNELDRLRQQLRDFAAERDWEQFHSPKNLSMALIVEAAELVEHFQWLTEAQSKELPAATRDKVEQELADIFLYLIRIADMLDMDLPGAAQRKIEINNQKYPATQVRGQSKKYTEY